MNCLHHSQHQGQSSSLPHTLGTIIKVDNSKAFPLKASSSNNKSKIVRRIQRLKKVEKSFSKLPKFLDPNLGLTGYLPTLHISYKTNMCQPWNIAPYFLNLLPQSSYSDLNDRILLLGGLNPTKPDDFTLGSSIFELNLKSKKWYYSGCLMEPRCYHSTVLVGSFLYISGGYSPLQRRNGEMVAMPDTHRLDLKTTLWKQCAAMNVARASHAMVAVEGYLYVFGGRNSSGSILTSVEVYNPKENAWAEITQLPRPSMGMSATYTEGKVWLVGGITTQTTEHQEECIMADVYSFSPSTWCWSIEDPLPEACVFSACVSSQDSIWVIGGSHLSHISRNKTLMSSSSVWHLSLYSKPQKWKVTSSLSFPTHASSAILCDNKIYMFGGIHSEENDSTNVVEIFNTDTKTYDKSLMLPTRIAGSSAVFLPKGLLGGEETRRKTFICPNEYIPKVSVLKKSRPKERSLTCHALSSIHYGSFQVHPHNISKYNTNTPQIHTPKDYCYIRDIEQESTTAHENYNANTPSFSSDTDSDEKVILKPNYPADTSKVHKFDINEQFPKRITKCTETQVHVHPLHKTTETYKFSNEQFYKTESKCTEMYIPYYSTQHKHVTRETRNLRDRKYISTLKIPLSEDSTRRTCLLNQECPIKSEIVLERRKWKPLIKYMPESSSDMLESSKLK